MTCTDDIDKHNVLSIVFVSKSNNSLDIFVHWVIYTCMDIHDWTGHICNVWAWSQRIVLEGLSFLRTFKIVFITLFQINLHKGNIYFQQNTFSQKYSVCLQTAENFEKCCMLSLFQYSDVLRFKFNHEDHFKVKFFFINQVFIIRICKEFLHGTKIKNKTELE